MREIAGSMAGTRESAWGSLLKHWKCQSVSDRISKNANTNLDCSDPVTTLSCCQRLPFASYKGLGASLRLYNREIPEEAYEHKACVSKIVKNHGGQGNRERRAFMAVFMVNVSRWSGSLTIAVARQGVYLLLNCLGLVLTRLGMYDWRPVIFSNWIGEQAEVELCA